MSLYWRKRLACAHIMEVSRFCIRMRDPVMPSLRDFYLYSKTGCYRDSMPTALQLQLPQIGIGSPQLVTSHTTSKSR